MGKHAFNDNYDIRKNKSKKFTPGMFYLHTVCSEKQLFMRATNTILGIRWNDRIIVIGIRTTKSIKVNDRQLVSFSSVV